MFDDYASILVLLILVSSAAAAMVYKAVIGWGHPTTAAQTPNN